MGDKREDFCRKCGGHNIERQKKGNSTRKVCRDCVPKAAHIGHIWKPAPLDAYARWQLAFENAMAATMLPRDRDQRSLAPEVMRGR